MVPPMLALVGLLLVVGCGDDERRRSDGGPRDDASNDAGEGPPRVVGTDPAAGEGRVASDRPVVLFFSRPMDERHGEVRAFTGTTPIVLGAREWAEGSTVLRYPAPELPVATDVRVEVRAFRGWEGETAEDFEFTFSTLDPEVPIVVASTPTEGARDVATDLAEVRVVFSKPMATLGEVALLGGDGEVGALVWETEAVRVPVSGLVHDTAYSLALIGFEDTSGNPLDGEPYLLDGAVDFSTGPDRTPPFVVDSNPSEGQLDVPTALELVTVDFSEPMDPALGVGTLSEGDDVLVDALVPAWSRGGTRAAFRVQRALSTGAAYRFALRGFVDLEGNPLDDAVYLGDGAIDFTAGVDLFRPFVVATNPEHRSTEVALSTRRVVVAFSEAMDTTRTRATFVSDLSTFEAEGTWSSAGTWLSFDVGTSLLAGQTYRVDLRGFRDAGGATLDAAHPYLGDGFLELGMVAPRGEDCQDALDLAGSSAVGAARRWVIASGQVSVVDGSAPCDTNGTSPDAVIRYRKSSATSVLAIRATSATSTRINVDVYREVCDPRAPAAGMAQLRCPHERTAHELFVDGDAGEYFVWVSSATGSTFAGATVEIEEIPEMPEGESCARPLVVGGSRFYSAPMSAGAWHEWHIPVDGISSHERTIFPGDTGAFSCDPNGIHGADVVVALEKTSATSVLQVEVEVAAYDALVEILDSCEPRGASVLQCAGPGQGTHRYDLEGAAGMRFVWVAENDASSAPRFTSPFRPDVRVRAREVEPGPGDSCATAIPIGPGLSVPVTPTGTQRIGTPSCFGTSAVTWYRFTATERLAAVRGNGAGALAARSVDVDAELACGATAVDGVAFFTQPGEQICVAVASGLGVTALDIETIPYVGVTGRVVNELSEPRSSSSGTRWTAVTPTRVIHVRSALMTSFERDGGPLTEEMLSFVDGGATLSIAGDDGLAIGEQIFVLASSSSLPNRLFRVSNGGPLDPVAWDVGSTWPASALGALAFDGSRFLVATQRSTTAPLRVFSVPAAGGSAVELGGNDTILGASAIAADDEWLYVARGATTAAESALYRVRLDRLVDPTATPEALPIAGLRLSTNNATLVLQRSTVPGAPSVLYFRGYAPTHVYAIVDPGGTPRVVGPIYAGGRVNTDLSMALDPSVPALYLIDSSPPATSATGVWLRLE